MRYLFIILLFCFTASYAQDTVYARKVIKKLTSKELLGRGYVNEGARKAAYYLAEEMKRIGLEQFGKNYMQTYHFPVNTFPDAITVKVDGKTLIAGKHYLIDPRSTTKKQSYTLFKMDSVTYYAFEGNKQAPVQVKLVKKLTYTVATETAKTAVIELVKDSFPKDIKTIDLQFENKFISKYECHNLIGYIKGTEQPDSFIVLTAHYDHLGAMGRDAWFPGANDNASGVSTVLNLARYYKKNPSKYSVAFIFFSGEEAGLKGSQYYTEHPLFPLPNIKFLTNLDLLGTGDDGIMVVNATVFKPQFEKLNAINTEKNYVKQIKQRGKAANSDHYWFAENNVPCFFIYTMGGVTYYHDVYDVERTLPLTDYVDVCKLLIDFNSKL